MVPGALGRQSETVDGSNNTMIKWGLGKSATTGSGPAMTTTVQFAANGVIRCTEIVQVSDLFVITIYAES